MIGVKISLEGDSRVLLKLLAEGLGQQIDNDRLALPSHIGEGFCKAYNLGNGISAIISECCYKIDFTFSGHKTSQPIFVLQYDHIEHCSKHEPGMTEQESLPFEYSDMIVAFTDHELEQPRNGGKKVRSLRILIQPEWMQSALPENMDNSRLLKFLELQQSKMWRVPLGSEERIWLKEVFTHDHATAWDDFFSVIRIKLLLEKFVSRMKRELSEKNTRYFTLFEQERLRKAEQHLVHDFLEPAPTINELAKEAGMSASKFKTDFRQLFGLPVYQYFQRSRMIHARNLLQEKNMTIKEVGMQVGYTNLSHFSVAFRKEFGILPSEMREGGERVL